MGNIYLDDDYDIEIRCESGNFYLRESSLIKQDGKLFLPKGDFWMQISEDEIFRIGD